MSQPVSIEEDQRDPEKKFIGVHLQQEVVNQLDAIAEIEDRGNRSSTVEKYIKAGVAGYLASLRKMNATAQFKKILALGVKHHPSARYRNKQLKRLALNNK